MKRVGALLVCISEADCTLLMGADSYASPVFVLLIPY